MPSSGILSDSDVEATAMRYQRLTPAIVTKRPLGDSPDISPVATMIAEDFGSVRVLATESPQPGSARGLPLAWESIAGTTVEVACARTGPKDRRGRGQRTRDRSDLWAISATIQSRKRFRHGTKRLVRYAGYTPPRCGCLGVAARTTPSRSSLRRGLAFDRGRGACKFRRNPSHASRNSVDAARWPM